jgi:hypothetical protein
MRCPPAIADAIQNILAQGLLRIRAAAWSGDVERCAWEADHLHNLPALLNQFTPDKLHYYWAVERDEFLRRCREAGIQAEEFESVWRELRGQLAAA